MKSHQTTSRSPSITKTRRRRPRPRRRPPPLFGGAARRRRRRRAGGRAAAPGRRGPAEDDFLSVLPSGRFNAWRASSASSPSSSSSRSSPVCSLGMSLGATCESDGPCRFTGSSPAAKAASWAFLSSSGSMRDSAASVCDCSAPGRMRRRQIPLDLVRQTFFGSSQPVGHALDDHRIMRQKRPGPALARRAVVSSKASSPSLAARPARRPSAGRASRSPCPWACSGPAWQATSHGETPSSSRHRTGKLISTP